MGRIGGFERDFSQAAWDKINKFMEGFPKAWAELQLAFSRNRIFMDRTIHVGEISAEKVNELRIHWSQPQSFRNRL